MTLDAPSLPAHQLPIASGSRQVIQDARISEADLRSWVSLAYERAVWAKKSLPSKLPELWGATLTFENPAIKPIVANNIAFATHDPICAERQGLKEALENFPTGKLKTLSIINANFHDPYLKTQCSCHLCMETFYNLLEHKQLLTPETLLVYIAQNAHHQPELVAQPLKAIFPSFNRTVGKPSDARHVDLNQAPLEISPSAAPLLDRLGKASARRAMIEARAAHDEAIPFKRSGRNGRYTGATLVFLPKDQKAPTFVSSSSLHPKQTTPLFADIAAASHALTETFAALKTQNHKPLPSLKMAAYYSENTHELPRPVTLGQLYKLSGNPDLLITTLEQGKLYVRTLSEWQSVQYQKAHDLQA